MPKRDDDLFTRLRRAGVRKPVAKTLSELSGDAGKKAAGAGHKAIADLRALADEIETRLPAPASVPAPKTQPTPVSTSRRRATTKTQPTPVSTSRRRATTKTQPSPVNTSRRRATTKSTTSTPKAATPRRRTPDRPTASTPSAAPRGENKAKILAALKKGPRTASEVSAETGIATATVSTALTRLSKAGEITKATRGYALPS